MKLIFYFYEFIKMSQTMRKLNKEEINDILLFIVPNPNIPEETANIIVKNNKKILRRQLQEVEIYPTLILALKNNIKNMYLDSQVQPGECVGVITAQSIGEKQTQANLNSVDWTEKIMYMNNNFPRIEYIGNFIDSLLEKNKDNVHYLNDTEYLETLNNNLYIPSSDSKGNCDWYQIEAVTRHLPKGKLVKIHTQSGRTVVGTQDLSFVVWNGELFEAKNGSELKIGDQVPTTINLKRFPNNNTTLNIREYFDFCKETKDLDLEPNFAILLASFFYFGLSENKQVSIHTTEISNTNINNIKLFCIKYNLKYTIDGENLCIDSIWLSALLKKIFFRGQNKIIPYVLLNSPSLFIFIFLKFINKYVDSFKYSKDQAETICLLYNYFGTFFTIEEIKRGLYQLKCTYNSIFTFDNIKSTNNNVYFDTIIKIELVESTHKYVYDLTVKDTRFFQLCNGITVNDTFHKAGSAEKQPVVSKFSELLNATNKPKSPSYYIYFNRGTDDIKKLRNIIKYNLVELTFKRIVESITIITNKEKEEWYDLYYFLYQKEEIEYKDCLSMKINMNILYEYKLTLKDICDSLELQYNDMKCIFSPDCFGTIDIFVDTENIVMPQKDISFITEENKNQIYLEEVVEPNIESTIICGVQGITNMFFLKENKEWLVETENSKEKVNKKTKSKNKDKSDNSTKRFKKVLALPFVDETRTISNSVWDIYYTFGIEAARQYMIDEFSNIMTGINICHVMLLVDKMTFTGNIASVSRYSMRRDESGPFGKASFEETLDNFLIAGAYGQEEPTKGVSASIICGKKANIGTGLCDINMNINKIIKNKIEK